MPRRIPRFHVELDFGQLSDDDRHQMVTGIQEVAPLSELYAKSPAIQASVAALIGKVAVLQTRNEKVVAGRAQLRADISDEGVARSDVDGELLTLATLTEVSARKPGDIASMAFKYLDTTRSKLPPAPPDTIDVEIPKRGHGKATVSAHQSDRTRRHYEAEACLFGQDIWTRLPGHGKSRTLRGATGTQIYVRMATVRGELQSEWCTPVLVTLP
jgi:hypothetical protein